MKLSFECDLRWDDLGGFSNIKRHCKRCDHDVYNLSGMTRSRARRVLALHGEKKLCVHFVSRNGEIVHGGDPLAQLARQKKGAGKLLAAALIVQAAFSMLADPTEHALDPFSALAHEAKAALADPVEEKSKKDEGVVSMGMVF